MSRSTRGHSTDWNTIAVIVGANTVTTALVVGLGLWLTGKRRDAPAEKRESSMTSVAEPRLVEPAVERPAPVVSPRDIPERDIPDREIPQRGISQRGIPQREVAEAPRPVEPKGRGHARRPGLRESLAGLGGVPGDITGSQVTAIRRLLGKSAPISSMSAVQADALLAARDYAEAVVDSRIGADTEFPGRRKIVRRLTLAIVTDDRARDFVVDWAAGHFDGDDDTVPVDPVEEEVWSWAQHHAARLLEADGSQVAAA